MYKITFCNWISYSELNLIEEWIAINDGCWINGSSIGVKTEADVISFKLYWPNDEIFDVRKFELS